MSVRHVKRLWSRAAERKKVLLAAALALGLLAAIGGGLAIASTNETTVTDATTTPDQTAPLPHNLKVVGKFATGTIRIPINHTGHYVWASPPVQLDHPPASLATSWRVAGTADIENTDAKPEVTPDGWAMKVSFDVQSYTPGAAFVLLRSEAHDPVSPSG